MLGSEVARRPGFAWGGIEQVKWIAAISCSWTVHRVSASHCEYTIPHIDDHTKIWMHRRFYQWHLLDYAIVCKHNMQNIYNVYDIWTVGLTIHLYMPKYFWSLSQLLEITLLWSYQSTWMLQNNAQGTQQAWLEIPIKSTNWDEGHVQIYNAAKETGC